MKPNICFSIIHTRLISTLFFGIPKQSFKCEFSMKKKKKSEKVGKVDAFNDLLNFPLTFQMLPRRSPFEELSIFNSNRCLEHVYRSSSIPLSIEFHFIDKNTRMHEHDEFILKASFLLTQCEMENLWFNLSASKSGGFQQFMPLQQSYWEILQGFFKIYWKNI